MLEKSAQNESLEEASKKLTYNKVSTMLWSARQTEQTWTYLPNKDTIFHRHIHIGNFLYPAKRYNRSNW